MWLTELGRERSLHSRAWHLCVQYSWEGAEHGRWVGEEAPTPPRPPGSLKQRTVDVQTVGGSGLWPLRKALSPEPVLGL